MGHAFVGTLIRSVTRFVILAVVIVVMWRVLAVRRIMSMDRIISVMVNRVLSNVSLRVVRIIAVGIIHRTRCSAARSHKAQDKDHNRHGVTWKLHN